MCVICLCGSRCGPVINVQCGVLTWWQCARAEAEAIIIVMLRGGEAVCGSDSDRLSGASASLVALLSPPSVYFCPLPPALCLPGHEEVSYCVLCLLGWWTNYAHAVYTRGEKLIKHLGKGFKWWRLCFWWGLEVMILKLIKRKKRHLKKTLIIAKIIVLPQCLAYSDEKLGLMQIWC